MHRLFAAFGVVEGLTGLPNEVNCTSCGEPTVPLAALVSEMSPAAELVNPVDGGSVKSGMTVAPPLLVKVTVTAEVAAGWESVTVTVVLWFIAIILAKARLDCNEAMESLSRYFRCQSK